MCVYCYHAKINFVIKLVIQEKKKRVKLAIVQVFDWLSKHAVFYFLYEWVWLFGSITNIMLMSWALSFSFYKNNDK